MANRYDTNVGSTFTYNKVGLVVWNATNEIISENNISVYLERASETESFGIRMKNLGGDYDRYKGFLKESLSSDCWWNLYKKTNEQFCYDSSIRSVRRD